MFGLFDSTPSEGAAPIAPFVDAGGPVTPSPGVPRELVGFAQENHEVVGEVIQDSIDVIKIVGGVFACAAIGHAVLGAMRGR